MRKASEKVRALTAHEDYLLSLAIRDSRVSSNAKSRIASGEAGVVAKRSAIAAAGLTGKTRAEIRKVQMGSWKGFAAQEENRNLPNWLVAARKELESSSWETLPPFQAGRVVSSYDCGVQAHRRAPWKRLMKRYPGAAGPNEARIRTESKGSGWDTIVWHYADYLCVVSPDGKQVALQFSSNDPIEIRSALHGRCKYRGEYIKFDDHCEQVDRHTARITCRRLRRAGFTAKLVRQTRSMVSMGSGDSLRKGGQLYCVVDDGIGGWYHVGSGYSADSVRTALARRAEQSAKDKDWQRIAARNKRIDLVLQENADKIWVRIEDSLNSGNCSPGTSAFVRIFREKLGACGELGAATAKAILDIRNDSFTLRACRLAALRYESQIMQGSEEKEYAHV